MRWLFVIAGAAIDGLQAALYAWCVAMAGTIIGAGVGCAVGAKIAGSTGCAIGATVVGILGTFANPALGPVAGPLLGYVLSVCITFSFGVLLVTLMWLSGAFYPGATLLVFLGEVIPFFNCSPGWGIYAWRCVSNYYAEERKKTGGGVVGGALAGAALSVAIRGAAPSLSAVGGVRMAKQFSDGVRPRGAANDNQPMYDAKAA